MFMLWPMAARADIIFPLSHVYFASNSPTPPSVITTVLSSSPRPKFSPSAKASAMSYPMPIASESSVQLFSPLLMVTATVFSFFSAAFLTRPVASSGVMPLTSTPISLTPALNRLPVCISLSMSATASAPPLFDTDTITITHISAAAARAIHLSAPLPDFFLLRFLCCT